MPLSLELLLHPLLLLPRLQLFFQLLSSDFLEGFADLLLCLVQICLFQIFEVDILVEAYGGSFLFNLQYRFLRNGLRLRSI